MYKQSILSPTSCIEKKFIYFFLILCSNILMQFIGYILIVFAAADFLAGNFGNVNLTSFLGPASQFSPIILGVIGVALVNMGGSKKPPMD